MIFYLIYLLLIFQRLSEIIINSIHLKKIRPHLFSSVNEKEKKQMIFLHSMWFLASLGEFQNKGQILLSPYFEFLLSLLIILQIVRFLIIKSLKGSWTTLPVAFRGQRIHSNGLYRFIRHPNYLIVIMEMFLYPLLGQCFYTSIFFGLINIIFIVRRIKLEENELLKIEEYEKVFKMKKKLIPFFFLFLLSFNSFSREIQVKSENYEAASKAKSYFKFVGESTKLGLITTEFDGYARVFDLRFKQKAELLEDVVLTAQPHEFDTDNNQRNEKMWELCLETKKYPTLKVSLEKIDLTKNDQMVDAVMDVRDQKLNLKIKIKKISDQLFSGESSFKLSDAHIPDPSIAIASVKDEFKINFKVDLSE